MAVRISKSMLPSLLDRLESHFPASLPIRGALRVLLQWEADDSNIWVDKWPEVNAVLICPSNDKTGVPVIHYERKLFATNVESARLLLEDRLPTDGLQRVDFACRELIWPAVTEVAATTGHRTSTEGAVMLLYLPDTVTIPDSCQFPEDLVTGVLEPCHAPMLGSLWVYGPVPGTDEYLRGLIQSFPSVAVYDRKSGALVAWMISYEDGSMGHLYVCPSYRRRGLARLVLARQAGKLRDQGQTPYVYIEVDNTPSLELHKKLGFVTYDKEMVCWVSCSLRT